MYQASTGIWYATLSGSGYSVVSLQLGGIRYNPVQSDYDNDGMTDPAVYNITTGIWTVTMSGSGYTRYSATLGGPGYTPVR